MEVSLAEKAYFDPINPGSYGGVDRLYRQLKSKGFTRKDVQEYLRGNETYTLHKDRRFHFRRNRVVAFSKDFQWMADLADMQKYSKQNSGYKYILIVIDVFTKYIWARALHSKQPRSVTQAFENIFELDGRKPLRLQTDRGREFDSAYLREFYKKHKITYFTSWNKTYKCSVVERANRTIKSRMFRYFTANNNHQWVHVLQKIVDSYNNSYHRSIKMTPNEACEALTRVVFNNLYGYFFDKQRKKPMLNVGDKVRVAYDRGVFDKSYEKTHTIETAKVVAVARRPYPMYSLRDWSGEHVNRKFYPQELQLISTHRGENIENGEF